MRVLTSVSGQLLRIQLTRVLPSFFWLSVKKSSDEGPDISSGKFLRNQLMRVLTSTAKKPADESPTISFLVNCWEISSRALMSVFLSGAQMQFSLVIKC
jgi:hypothetical protein